ncbi:MAG: hypothetical protein QFX38_07305 [Methanothermobacter sp.]|nr:hypothetical protein [Methanothermobacter sp.]
MSSFSSQALKFIVWDMMAIGIMKMILIFFEDCSCKCKVQNLNDIVDHDCRRGMRLAAVLEKVHILKVH